MRRRWRRRRAFRSAVLVAASIIDAALSDNITINIQVGYGEINNGTPLPHETGAEGSPNNQDILNYASVRNALISQASPGDSTFNALPTNPIQGTTNVEVFSAEEKALGIQPQLNRDDGAIGIGTNVPTSQLVGVALHEIGHAMGRFPVGPGIIDIFDFFKFSSPGVQLLAAGNTAPPAYFSIDGGVTDLADYGQTSDPSDFLNNAPDTARFVQRIL